MRSKRIGNLEDPTTFLRHTHETFQRPNPTKLKSRQSFLCENEKIHFHAPCRLLKSDRRPIGCQVFSTAVMWCAGRGEKIPSGRKEVNRKSAMSLKMQVSTHMLCCQPQRFHLPKNIPQPNFHLGKYFGEFSKTKMIGFGAASEIFPVGRSRFDDSMRVGEIFVEKRSLCDLESFIP
jgi:hypothetical protein